VSSLGRYRLLLWPRHRIDGIKASHPDWDLQPPRPQSRNHFLAIQIACDSVHPNGQSPTLSRSKTKTEVPKRTRTYPAQAKCASENKKLHFKNSLSFPIFIPQRPTIRMVYPDEALQPR
jgi:hypothetical protein